MATVNEKSTKPEIWAAFKELQAHLETRPVAIIGDNNDVKVTELGAALEQAKSALLVQFETAQKVADSAASDYTNSWIVPLRN